VDYKTGAEHVRFAGLLRQLERLKGHGLNDSCSVSTADAAGAVDASEATAQLVGADQQSIAARPGQRRSPGGLAREAAALDPRTSDGPR
jgi:hypothetical protein